MSLIVCPICHSGLAGSDDELHCPACPADYAVEHGVPILIPATVGFLEGDERWTPPAALSANPRLKDWLDRVRSRLNVAPVYKTERSRSVVRDYVATFPEGSIVLNIGSGTTRYGIDVLNLEIAPDPEVDVVAVAEWLPIADESVDGAILMAVLEHVQSSDRTLSEAQRVLRIGGTLLVDVPFIQGYHAAPGDYRRFTEQGLRAEIERYGFEVEESGVAVGPASAMSWVTAEFMALLFSGRSAVGYRIARNVTGILAAPIKYADRWLETHPFADRIASAVWVRARRVA